MPWILSDNMADQLRALVRKRAGAAVGSGGFRGSAPVFVECDSATAAGASAILSECYPGHVLAPASDAPLPPEEPEAGGVLLTLIGTDGESVAPVEGGVYLCLISGNVDEDAAGYSPGRPRAFGVGASAGGGDTVTYDPDSYPPTISITTGDPPVTTTYTVDPRPYTKTVSGTYTFTPRITANYVVELWGGGGGGENDYGAGGGGGGGGGGGYARSTVALTANRPARAGIRPLRRRRSLLAAGWVAGRATRVRAVATRPALSALPFPTSEM